MNCRRRSLPIAMLACAALLAGCGSGGGNGSSTGASSTGATTASTAQSGSKLIPKSGSEIVRAIAECRQIIASQKTLSSGAKAKLKGACAQAAKGNTVAVKKAAREVCEEVVSTSAELGGAKERALKACRK